MLRFCFIGLLLVATEGINGTIAGSSANIDEFLTELKTDERFHDIDYKLSLSETLPFYRMNVKVKRELITLNKPEANPALYRGEYVEPKDWNALISDPDVILLDTRNDYEIAIGKFQNAISPETKSFSEFPKFVEQELGHCFDKKIAMYCTGGIR
jgi:UPF0176 protein